MLREVGNHEQCKLYLTDSVSENLSQSIKKKKKNTPVYFKTNYRREIKLAPINMDYSLLQFHDLKFVLGVHLHGGFVTNFNFFNIKPQI